MDLKSEDSTTTQMQAILRFAHALRDATGVSLQPLPVASTIINSISLPTPPPLLPFLLDTGLTQETAIVANKLYESRSEELRQHVQGSIISACHKIVELPTVALASTPESLIRKVVSTFTEGYLRRLEQWKEEVIHRIKHAPKASPNAVQKISRAFNREYVPLLEYFFEENPFPTHAHKVFLAKKSNMEYKQIHVWFQNRRNRTKREGKTLRKKPTYESATKPLDKLSKHMQEYRVAPNSQAPNTFKPGLGPFEETPQNAFVSSSPPHAFPLPYPPTCSYDPFPCKNGPVFLGQPKWKRVADERRPVPLSTSSTGIDDLVDKFSHLNVRDGSCSKASPELQSHAATVAITVIPSRAPHPSLVVPKYSQPKKLVQLLPLVRASVSCSKAFQSPSPDSTPITLVPLLTPPNASKHRKITPLPQRIPLRTRNTCRDTTPSEYFSTSSSPYLFSTGTEGCSYSHLGTGLLFTPSDAESILQLPHLFESSSACRSPLDSPIHLRGLGGMIAISPSPV